MFGLIISIVSIALVVAIMVMTMSYSGDTTNQGRTQATVAQILSEASQLKLAMQRRAADAPAAELLTLPQLVTEGYLTALPTGWVEAANLNLYTHITTPVQGSSEQNKLTACNKVNETFGITTIPACTTVAAGFSGCCTG